MSFYRFECTKCKARVLAFESDLSKPNIHPNNLAWETDQKSACIDGCNFVKCKHQPEAVAVHGTTGLMVEGMVLDSTYQTEEHASEEIRKESDRKEAIQFEKQKAKM